MADSKVRYTGKRLGAFIRQLRASIDASLAPVDIRERAQKMLFGVERSGEWLTNHDQFPSLPGRPGFTLVPAAGKSRSRLPVPAHRRAAFKGQRQLCIYWPGDGLTAYAHYVAEIDARLDELAGPEPSTPPEETLDLASVPLDDIRQLEPYKGRTNLEIDAAANLLFRCRAIGGRKSKDRVKQILSCWRPVVAYLAKRNSLRFDQIDDSVLEDFRAWCERQLQDGVLRLKTVNNYLYTFRYVLGLCQRHLRMSCIPDSYHDLIANIPDTEAAKIGKRAGVVKGGQRFGYMELVAYPTDFIGSLLRLAEPSPLDHLILLLSMNLAAGAKDISALTWWDMSGANPVLRIDLERKLFVNILREKSWVASSTMTTDRGEKAIPLMKRTYDALVRWKDHVPVLRERLRNRLDLHEQMQRTLKARELKAKGLSQPQIAQEMGLAPGSVYMILHQPGSLREWFRKLASDGYSLKQIVTITGAPQSTVQYHTQDLTVKHGRKPSRHIKMIREPDENLLLFVPDSGQPLGKYVEDMFRGLCKQSGVIFEEDVASGEVEPPPKGTFVLPAGNRHYGIRRTVATVCGMVGGVSPPVLQLFMGHKSLDQTFEYLRDPPASYQGKRMAHSYDFKLQQRPTDPIGVIEDFVEICIASRKPESPSPAPPARHRVPAQPRA